MSILDYTKDVFQNPSLYKKFWVAVAGSTITYLTVKFGATPEISLVTGYLTAIGVFGVSNK